MAIPRNLKIFKQSVKEKKEHPWMTRAMAYKVAADHERKLAKLRK